MTAAPEAVQNPPYTYFRADGHALDAVETVQAAKREMEKLRRDLCRRFGANEVLFTPRTEGQSLSIYSFHFTPAQEKDVPAHWESRRQTGSDGAVQAVFASPPAGSPDHFFLTDYAGLMQRAARQSRLENVFGSGEMPRRELPAGEYEPAFVRESHMRRSGRAGRIQQEFVGLYASNSPCSTGDMLEAAQMADSWYIRVPNDATGKPRFTPPDSAVVDMAEMVTLDAQEYAARNARARAASFDPQI